METTANNDVFRFQITEEMEEERIDKCLSSLIDSLTRTYIQKLLKEERVTVNGKIIKANYRAKCDDDVCLILPKPIELKVLPENIPLSILFEDDSLLIVNKPKGMVVHPAAGHYTGTLVNAVMYHCKDQLSGINGVMRPGIVHRIDKDTTGSLIICKNDQAHNHIAKQLKEHTMNRTYQAICCGNVTAEEGHVDAPIGRHEMDRKKMAINHKNGKHALTHYKVLKRSGNYTFLECVLETGRTHQIRVHMQSIGHPLLGDDVYGGARSAFPLLGQCLHARTIGFVHPVTEQFIQIDAPLPEYLESLLKVIFIN